MVELERSDVIEVEIEIGEGGRLLQCCQWNSGEAVVTQVQDLQGLQTTKHVTYRTK